MFVGAHVSTAGGFAKAIERGQERGCESIQIFHQSPRTWRPTKYGTDDFAAFREGMEGSKVEAVIIHAVYLINRVSKTKSAQEIADRPHPRARIGDGIGANGVVLHPGSKKDGPLKPALKRASKVIARRSRTRPLPAADRADRRPKGLLGATSTRPRS